MNNLRLSRVAKFLANDDDADDEDDDTNDEILGHHQVEHFRVRIQVFRFWSSHCPKNDGNYGMIHGAKLGPLGLTISHLFYDDDVGITTDWSAHDLENIIRVLQVFYLAFGLRINIHKSNVYGIGVPNEDVTCMANNSGGRLMLIKAVLGSLRIYFLSIFKVLKLVLNALERIRASFFWGGTKELKKLAWIKWPNVLSSFKKVIKALHGQEGGFDQQGCKFNGSWAKIDTWLGDAPLYIGYNRLYRLDQDKDCLIIDRIENRQWLWNWSRADLGVRNLAYLRDMLIGISHADTNYVEDSCIWTIAGDGVLSVRNTHRHIDAQLLPSLATSTT
ncbi:hypothetical protein Tco_0232955 [Tanacetum coccineum]